jgi:hypothetical protein
MTRLAADRRVYFFESPPRACRLPLVGAIRAGVLTVLTPYLPDRTPAVVGHRLLAPLLESALDSDGVQVPTVWCFDAQSLPLVAALRIGVVVYDCCREPATSAVAAEAAALARADIVFAADSAQYARLRPRHDRVHFVPGSASWASTCAAMRAIVDGAPSGAPDAIRDTTLEARGYRVIRGAERRIRVRSGA